MTDRALVALFLMGLAAPTADLFLRPGASRSVVSVEERKPAPLPEVDLSVQGVNDFPRRFEDWFDDTCGLRDRLLAWESRVKCEAFGVSPTAKLVLGEDGWIWLAEGRSIEVFRGVEPFRESELEAWRRCLESRADWSARRGIEYVFAIAPNKTEIYPERVPGRFNRVGPTRLDQLVGWLDGRSTVRILDLRPALLAEKGNDGPDDFAYFPLGTHWTDRGVYAVYVEVVRRLAPRFPGLAPIPREKLVWRTIDEQGDSWAGRLYMEGRMRQVDRVVAEVPRPDGASAGPRLLMLHDSFGDPLKKLLEPLFSRAVFSWQNNFDPGLIEAEKPDVVLQLLTERTLARDAPTIVPGGDTSELKTEFEASRDVMISIDGRRRPPQVDRWGETVLAPLEDGLEIRTRTAGDMIRLPPFEFPAGGDPVLRIDITSEAPAPLVLLYQTKQETEYQRKNSYNFNLEAGRNVVYFEMLDASMTGRMLVRPGLGDGRFVLHALEVRKVKR